ncbi:hypothetical protein HY496_01505 [Candidatus Woesearchaeota archaeon]|nr:hypothetical protein [Candidatus Woesearchaeota archaeon]
MNTTRTSDFYVNLSSFEAVGLAEGFVNARTLDEHIAAWQYLVDTGLCWKLQGWFGRTAQTLIDEGIIDVPIKTKSTIVK